MSYGFQSPNMQTSLSRSKIRMKSYWGPDNDTSHSGVTQSLLSATPCRNKFILICPLNLVLHAASFLGSKLCDLSQGGDKESLDQDKESKADICVLTSRLGFWPNGDLHQIGVGYAEERGSAASVPT